MKTDTLSDVAFDIILFITHWRYHLILKYPRMLAWKNFGEKSGRAEKSVPHYSHLSLVLISYSPPPPPNIITETLGYWATARLSDH